MGEEEERERKRDIERENKIQTESEREWAESKQGGQYGQPTYMCEA